MWECVLRILSAIALLRTVPRTVYSLVQKTVEDTDSHEIRSTGEGKELEANGLCDLFGV